MTPAHLPKLSRLRRAGYGDGSHPAPPDDVPPHPGAESLGRRLAESAFTQLLPLWAAARGNPSDPFGGGLGGLSANGTVADRQFGRYLPVFWSELDLRSHRVLARHLCDTNPFAIGFMQLLKGYHVRKGYGWQACLKGAKKGGYSTQTSDNPIVTKAQNVLDAFRDAAQWPLKSREAFLRWRRDGEVFVRFGSGGYGKLPWVRFVDPEQVGSPVGDTNTDGAFGIETEDGDHDSPVQYHVWDADDPTEGRWVDASRVVHLKANVDSGVKRGLTDFYSLSEALDNTRRLLLTMLATAVKQARVAWVEKIAGTQQQALSAPEFASTATNRLQPYGLVDDFTRALTDQFGRFGVGGQHLSDIRRVEGSRQFEPGPTSSPSGYIEVEQASLRACGVRWNFPEYFSGDASNNNMASSIVAGSPFTVTVEGNQLEFGHGFERPCALKVLELARDAGVLSYDEWRRLDVEVTEPAVATPDPLKDTQVYTSQLQAKIVSLDTVRQKLGYDPRHEAEGVKKDAQDQQPPPGGDDPFGGTGDGAQLPSGGGGGDLPDPLGDALGEAVEYVTEGLYALLSEADRSRLVKKVITNRAGRKQTVYVRPDDEREQADAAKKAKSDAYRAANDGLTPKEVLQKKKADAEPARALARAEYAKAVSDPASYDPEAMARHLESLTRDELREHARAVSARLGGLKSELVGRLLDNLAKQAPADEPKPEPEKPTEPQNVAELEALGKELDAAYAATRNPPEGADYAALRAKRDELEQRYAAAKQRLGAAAPADPTDANRGAKLAKEPVPELTPQQAAAGGWAPVVDTNRDGKLLVHPYRASAQVRAAQSRAATGDEVAVIKNPDGSPGYIVLSRKKPADAPRRRGDEAAPTADEFAAASRPAQQSGQNPSTVIDKRVGGSNTTPTPPTSGGDTSGGAKVDIKKLSAKESDRLESLLAGSVPPSFTGGEDHTTFTADLLDRIEDGTASLSDVKKVRDWHAAYAATFSPSSAHRAWALVKELDALIAKLGG